MIKYTGIYIFCKGYGGSPLFLLHLEKNIIAVKLSPASVSPQLSCGAGNENHETKATPLHVRSLVSDQLTIV